MSCSSRVQLQYNCYQRCDSHVTQICTEDCTCLSQPYCMAGRSEDGWGQMDASIDEEPHLRTEPAIQAQQLHVCKVSICI